MISLIYCKIFYLYFLRFCLVCGQTYSIVIPFLSFKRTTHAYLLKISITRKSFIIFTYQFISAGSAPQKMVFKNEYTFGFFKFSNTWFV